MTELEFETMLKLKKQFDAFKVLQEELKENLNENVVVSGIRIQLTGSAATTPQICISFDKEFCNLLYRIILNEVVNQQKYLRSKINSFELGYYGGG